MSKKTDYTYFSKWNFNHIFKDYDGSKGFLVLKPWPGGFNNIRQSLELAVCYSFLTNRVLVLPEKYNMYLVEGDRDYGDFFNLDDIGIKTISMKKFCSQKNISCDYDSIYKISDTVNIVHEDSVINFEKTPVPFSFLKNKSKYRRWLRGNDLFVDSEVLFLDKNLLGSWYQIIYSSLEKELNMLVAKHIRYRDDIFDLAHKMINFIGDGSYYSIHIRRNDFQYTHLFISCEDILNSIKNIVPIGSKLYISTDHKDKDFFKPLKDNYDILFYDDVSHVVDGDHDVNWIPIFEQLICTRGIKFIGNKHSTLSSYAYRLRGYMDDIEDKNYYVNTEIFDLDKQRNFENSIDFDGAWSREYKDGWDFKKEKIFVSIASYRDTQIVETIKSIYDEACNPERIVVAVLLQDSQEMYELVSALEYPNLKIKHVLSSETLGCPWARDILKEEVYDDEDYFFQIDSHSRVKKHWDNILIKQHKSLPIEKQRRAVITTYPNHFEVPDNDRSYLKFTNNPSMINTKPFNVNNPYDNRFRGVTSDSVKDFITKKSKWVAGGFVFATGLWAKEIRTPPGIFSVGEEDFLTFQSYLKGWNLYTTSEATLWHNYSYKNTETDEPYRVVHTHVPVDYKEESVSRLNNLLLEAKNGKFKRTLEQCERYFLLKFTLPSEQEDISHVTVEDVEFEILEDPAKISKKHKIKEWMKISKKIIAGDTNVKKSRNNIQLRKRR